MHSVKSRSKALKVAAGVQGVVSVTLEGEDQVVVTGNGVDPVCLTNVLRKKFRYANLLTVEGVNDGGEGGEGNNEETNPTGCTCNYSQFPPPCPTYHHVLYDPYPS